MDFGKIWEEMKFFLTAPKGKGMLGATYWLILIVALAGVVYLVYSVIKKFKQK